MDDGHAGGFEEATSHQRTAPRDSMLLTAVLSDEAGEAVLRVRNLSAGGLMADCDGCPGKGTPVTVRIRGIGDVPGRIAWAEPGRVGVAFDLPVDPRNARRPVTARSTSKLVGRRPGR